MILYVIRKRYHVDEWLSHVNACFVKFQINIAIACTKFNIIYILSGNELKVLSCMENI